MLDLEAMTDQPLSQLKIERWYSVRSSAWVSDCSVSPWMRKGTLNSVKKKLDLSARVLLVRKGLSPGLSLRTKSSPLSPVTRRLQRTVVSP